MNLLTRIRNSAERSKQLSKILGPSYLVPWFFATRHYNPRKLFSFSYKKHKLFARNTDYPALREIYFEQEYAFLNPLLGRKSPLTVLDIGGHIGLFALWVLERSPSSTVLSIEASPSTYKILEHNRLSALQAHSYRWTSLHRAAWKTDEDIPFSDDSASMSSQISATGSSKVSGTSFKTLLDGLGAPRIDLMKVDIEGAEEAFLCEQPDLLRHVDRLVIELHQKYCDAGRVRTMLEKEFPHISEVQGRASSKAVLYCQRDLQI